MMSSYLGEKNYMTSSFVTVEGKRFHYIWLRDNCPCPQCREPKSWQKIFDISQQQEAPIPLSVNINDQELEIIWKEEPPHRSLYNIPWLLSHAYDHGSQSDRSPVHQKMAKRNQEQVLWNRDWFKSHKTAFTEWDYLVGRKNYMMFKHFFEEENVASAPVNQDNKA